MNLKLIAKVRETQRRGGNKEGDKTRTMLKTTIDSENNETKN